MNLYINRRQRIEKDKIIIVKRSLPGKGNIFVKDGQELTPDEVLGNASILAGFRSIHLAKQLGVSPKEALKYLNRPIGQKIYKGELLAYKKGSVIYAEKVVTAPTDGVLNSYDDRQDSLKIEFLQHQADLASSVYGVVEKVDKLRGEVWIRTEATVISGLLGSGKARDGLLVFLDGRSSLVAKESIHRDLGGAIVVAGGLLYKSALMQAIEYGVHGIITGGINAIDFQGISGGRIFGALHLGTDIGISIVVSEGFGSIPMGEDIYSTLAEGQSKFAILDGNRKILILPSNEATSMSRIRKTKLPPSSHFDKIQEPEATTLKKNLQVRVVSTPYFGEQGMVVEVDQTPSKLESGIVTYLVTIKTRTRKIRIPYANIEAI